LPAGKHNRGDFGENCIAPQRFQSYLLNPYNENNDDQRRLSPIEKRLLKAHFLK
jgi:hypothetical protein